MFFEKSKPKLMENCEKKLKHHRKSKNYPGNAWKPLKLLKRTPF